APFGRASNAPEPVLTGPDPVRAAHLAAVPAAADRPKTEGTPVPSTASKSRRDVAVVPWPAGTTVREQLATLRVPRVLLVAEDQDPPDLLDELEDWVREGVHPDDLAARTRPLAARAAKQVPTVDAEGLVRFGSSWTVVPPNQIGVTRLLVEHFDQVVPRGLVAEAYVSSGGSAHPNSMRSVTVRLAHRLAELDLELVTIRARGFMLTWPAASAG
ncbi:MAG: hypothetical protein M3Z03_13825, partial [Actinomycetota bacterium]|nr:hypothetical protein [Actinomycetota bacterium]